MNWRQVLGSKLAGPAFFAFAIKIASAGLSYLMLVAFARMLGADDYGKFGVMLNLGIVLSTVIGFGLPTTILRWWPEYIVKGDPEKAAGAMKGSVRLLAGASLLLMLVGAIASALGLGQNMFGFAYGALAVAILASVTIFGDFLSGALRAAERTVFAMAPRDIIWRIASPLLAFLVFRACGFANAAIAIACVIAVLVIIDLVQYAGLRKTVRSVVKSAAPKHDWPVWRKTLLPIWGAAILTALIQQLDVVVVGSMLGTTEAGAYFAAQKTANLLGLAMIAGGLVGAPIMAAHFHANKISELQKLCRLIAIAIAVTTMIGVVVEVLFGRQLLGIFDASFAAYYPILMMLCLGYAIDSLSGPNAYLMQVVGLERSYLRIMAVVYCIVLVLQLALIPHYGAIAAAGANAFGTCLWNIAAIWLLRRKIGVDPSILSLFKSVSWQTRDQTRS
jgi:O-antigen/teichoic acid export membrane protein